MGTKSKEKSHENQQASGWINPSLRPPVQEIFEVIREDDVSILLLAGLYDQTLTVTGDNFTLVGEAGDDCGSGDWTLIAGKVVVNGDNATFRNISFGDPVEVYGSNVRFIHCCFGGELVVFGDETNICDDDDDDCDHHDDFDDHVDCDHHD